MKKITVECEVADAVDGARIEALVTGLVSLVPGVTKVSSRQTVTGYEEEVEDKDAGVSSPTGEYPDLVQTTRFYVMIEGKQQPVTRQMWSMCAYFCHVRTATKSCKMLLDALKQFDRDIWRMSNTGSVTKVYSDLRRLFGPTPYQLLAGGRYGFTAAALKEGTQQVRRSRA